MRGIFWVIDDSLIAFAFKEGAVHGVAKSGVTFNHKAYWNWAKPAHCKKPYNYYPRGRVDYTNQGKPIIFMNPHVDEIFVSEIITTSTILTATRLPLNNLIRSDK